MSHRVQVFVGVSVATLIIAIVAHLVAPTAGDAPTARGSAGVADPVPVAYDATAASALLRDVRGFTRDCVTQTSEPKPSTPAIADAVALLSCRATGAGAATVLAAKFTTREQTKAYLDERLSSLGMLAGPCDASRGNTLWHDRRRRERGAIVCGFGSGRAEVAWSHFEKRTVAVSNGPGLADLLEWWTEAVRPQQGFPTTEERALLDEAAKHVQIPRCVRDATGGSPFALASLNCGTSPRTRAGERIAVDAIFLERFETRDQLSRHFDTYASYVAPSATDDPERSCQSVVMEREGWFDDEIRGTRLCWDDEAGQHIIWTDERQRIFGEVRRDDHDVDEAFTAWQQVVGVAP